jgi:hypothetical protein
MSIRESNSRTFLREAGLDDWFGVIALSLNSALPGRA